jgi:outer membrane receptor for monomeric catechols
VSGRVRAWWTALANYAFMKSAIARSNNPAEVDQNLALTPEHTLSVWSTVILPRGFGLGAGAQYMDGVFSNATNTRAVPGGRIVTASSITSMAWPCGRTSTVGIARSVAWR